MSAALTRRRFVIGSGVMLSALLSGVAAPRAQAQESEWLEVQGSTTLTLRNGESNCHRFTCDVR